MFARRTLPGGIEVQHRLTTFILDGMRAGIAESKRKGDLLELAAALRIGLEVEDGAARWLAGEDLFNEAHMPATV